MDTARNNRRFNWQQKGWPTATRDLAELAATGAVVAEGVNTKTHYVLTCVLHEPQIFKNVEMREYGKIEKVDLSQQNQGSREKRADFGHEPISENEPLNEPLNEGINETFEERVLRLVTTHPGRGVPFLKATTQASRETVKRALAALIAAGKVEHRGSKKTGGYFAKDDNLQRSLDPRFDAGKNTNEQILANP